MLGRADGAIALNGSIGTLAELVMAWNVAFVAQFSNEVAKPVVTVGERWRRIIADLTDDLATDGSLVTCVDNVDAAVAAVSRALGDP
jgi:predicted Rossmann-fold nucleotide-binding protein